jgi:putative permease
MFFSDILLPAFVAVVFAYLLEGVVRPLQRVGMPRLPAVAIVFVLFMLVFVLTLFGLLPKLSRQVTALFQALPDMITRGEAMLHDLPQRYPNLFSEAQVSGWLDRIKDEVTVMGQQALAITVSSVVNIITFVVYLIIVPILVFFMMKDKQRILAWVGGYLPRDHALAATVWSDVDRQIGNYIRGKFWEILIIWALSYAVFGWFGLQYAVLLSFLVGLSVIIPYVGAVIVTIPIMMVAYFQWGLESEWFWVVGLYFVVQAIDANVVVPLLFSEVVDLLPIAIIVAVVFFGGIWGGGGVFFAIPLATLVQAVLKAWPSTNDLPVLTETSAGPAP